MQTRMRSKTPPQATYFLLQAQPSDIININIININNNNNKLGSCNQFR